MKKVKGLFATAAAAALLATTTAAAAAPAPSTAVTRAASPTAKESDLGARVPTATLFSIGILAVLVVIVLVATKKGKNGDRATSP